MRLKVSLKRSGTIVGLSFLSCVLATPPGAALAQGGRVGTWRGTGAMATPRATHTATLLTSGPNAGKVLVAGGLDGTTVLASAELYDPATGAWSNTGSLGTARANTFTATRLLDGRILVAGGQGRDNFGNVMFLASAELYDPLNGTWTPTGSMIGARRSHIAALLPNGKVLVAGGETGELLVTAELYDPVAGTWSSTLRMLVSRSGATAVLLPNGKVLVAGGVNFIYLNSAELYDPGTETWLPTGDMTTPRAFSNYEHAKLLSDGKVLVAGGQTTGGAALATAELYDPATGTWSLTGTMATARQKFSTTPLPDGRVLVAGGDDQVAMVLYASAEVYDPATGTWSGADSMTTARALHTATLLPNGEVLVAGGVDIENANHMTASAEVFAENEPPADLAIGKSGASTVKSGANLTYGIGVVNLGPNNATGVAVTDRIPTGTTFVSAQFAKGSCTVSSGKVSCTVSQPPTPCAFSNGVVTCNIGALAPFRASNPTGAGIQLVVHVTAPRGATITNTATVSASNPDPKPANNSSTATTSVR